MGKVLKVGATTYEQTSNLVAEACALKDGVLLTVQVGYMEISI